MSVLFYSLRQRLMLLQDFHHYLLNFIHRFLQPSSETLLAFNTTTTSSPTHRDTFGVHQLLIVATRFGTVHALDSSTGRIRWTRTFGLGWLGEPNFHDASGEEAGSGEIIGGRVEPTGVYVLRESEGERGAEVGVAARRRANNVSGVFGLGWGWRVYLVGFVGAFLDIFRSHLPFFSASSRYIFASHDR